MKFYYTKVCSGREEIIIEASSKEEADEFIFNQYNGESDTEVFDEEGILVN